MNLVIGEIFDVFGRGWYIIWYVELFFIYDGLVVDILGFSLIDFLIIEVGELLR